MDYKLNYYKDPEDLRDYRYTINFRSVADIISAAPKSVDHTDKMTIVKDQGRLGSCVAFAVASAKEWIEGREVEKLISEGGKVRTIQKYSRWTNVSESWIYWQSKKIDSWPNEEGTSIRFALKVLKTLGVPWESMAPYDDDPYPEKIHHLAYKKAKFGKIGSYWRISTLDELKAAVVNQPIPIGIPVFNEFFSPKDGIISYPKDPNNIYGGHAICIVGYNDDKGLVKFKNSWGENWGSKGYACLPYEYIRDFLWDAWIFTDISMVEKSLKVIEKVMTKVENQ